MRRRKPKHTDQDPTFRASPDALNAVERRTIIDTPLPVARKVVGKSWAGCFIKPGPLPESGARAYTPALFDDSEFVRAMLEFQTRKPVEDELWDILGASRLAR